MEKNEVKQSNLKEIQKKLKQLKQKSASERYHRDIDGIDFGEER